MKSLIELINNKKIISEKEIKEIVLSYIKENQLEEYLTNVNYCEGKTGYRRNDKIIDFNENHTIDLANELYNLFHDYFHIDKTNYSYYINFYYLYQIYHELFHVYQYNRDENGYKHSYSYLHKLNNKLIVRNTDYYDSLDGHIYFPMEIEADNYGFSTAYKIMKETNIPKKDLRVLYAYYLNILLYNYEIDKDKKIVTSPIEILSSNIDGINMDKVNEVIIEDNLNLLEKVKFGLPITFDEYSLILKKRDETKLLIKKMK